MKSIQVISLPGATARRLEISRTFSQHGLDFEFFDAIDGSRELGRYAELIDRAASEKIMGRSLTHGELGCALSHALLLRRFMGDGGACLFVFEDDIRLSKAALPVMRALAQQHAGAEELIVLPSGYDFHPRWRTRTKLGAGQALYANSGETYGTYGMFLTRAVAGRLLDDAIPVVVPADFVGRRYGRNRLAVRGVWPPVLQHPHFETHPEQSLIGRERSLQEQAFASAAPASSAALRLMGRLSLLVRQYL